MPTVRSAQKIPQQEQLHRRRITRPSPIKHAHINQSATKRSSDPNLWEQETTASSNQGITKVIYLTNIPDEFIYHGQR